MATIQDEAEGFMHSLGDHFSPSLVSQASSDDSSFVLVREGGLDYESRASRRLDTYELAVALADASTDPAEIHSVCTPDLEPRTPDSSTRPDSQPHSTELVAVEGPPPLVHTTDGPPVANAVDEPPLVHAVDLTDSTVMVQGCSAREVALIKSNNKDLTEKVRRLVQLMEALEAEKQVLELALEREREGRAEEVAELRGRLKGKEEELGGLEQLSQDKFHLEAQLRAQASQCESVSEQAARSLRHISAVEKALLVSQSELAVLRKQSRQGDQRKADLFAAQLHLPVPLHRRKKLADLLPHKQTSAGRQRNTPGEAFRCPICSRTLEAHEDEMAVSIHLEYCLKAHPN